MKNNKDTIKKTLKRLKPYSHLIALSSFLALIFVVLNLLIPILVGQAVDSIVGKGNVIFENVFQKLILIGICALSAGICQWIITRINNHVSFSVVKDLRNDLFSHVQKLPIKFLDNKSSGNIVSNMITDVDQFSDGLLLGFSAFLTGVMTILGTLFFMIYLNFIMALVVVLVTPLSFVVASFIAKRTHKMFMQQSEIRGEQTSIINESIGELKTVKAFSHEDEVLEKFDEVNERLRVCSLKAMFFSSITNPATRFVNSVVYSAVTLAGALLAVTSGFTVGALTSFLSYANQYTKPFNEISSVVTELQNAFACAKRVFDLLETDEVIEKSSGKAKEIEGDILIKDVKFSYSEEKELIKCLNLRANKGKRIAIVGPTGCGKTTMINLLMRFYEIQGGDIFIDNTNIKDMSYHELRSSFGMVLQDTWLKSGTIKENILLGRDNFSDEDVVNAAKKAHAHSFIKRLPNGYETEIGEAGGNLSQGEKQLLCIARLMISLPPMLILDEATSSIDTRTEIKIQKAFEEMMKGRTSFIVAHRLSTIVKCDTIIVMDKGKIIENGSHEELLKIKDGFYKNLYNSQFAK